MSGSGGGGFSVTPADLTKAAGELDPLPAQIRPAAEAVTGGIDAAVAVNALATSDALRGLDSSVQAVVGRAASHVDKHSKGLRASAASYTGTDEQAEADFKDVAKAHFYRRAK